jgi:hypothetical protein
MNPLASFRLWWILLVFPLSANSMTFREEKVTCPLDGTSFEQELVGSYTQFGVHLDLKPYGALIAPIPLPNCDSSRFPIYREDFSKEEIERLKAYVKSSEYQAMIENEAQYYVVAKLRQHLNEPLEKIAYSFLQATWQAGLERMNAMRPNRWQPIPSCWRSRTSSASVGLVTISLPASWNGAWDASVPRSSASKPWRSWRI